MSTWKTCKLGEVCTTVCSGGTPSAFKSEYYEGGTIPWLNTSEISFGSISSTQRYITESGFAHSAAKWIPKHTVIVAMYGATAGKVAYTECPITTNQACCNLVVDISIAHYKYVYYSLVKQYNYVKSLANGGAQQNLNAEKIKNLPLSLPPLAEQERIAGVLGAYDDLIAVNERRMALLEEAAHRLWRDRFVTHADPAWPLRPLGEVTEGEHTNLAWRKCPLGELVSITMGQSPESCYYNVEQVGLPFHQGVGTFGAWFPQEEVYTSKYSREAHAGDILFSVRAPVGRINLADKHCAIGRGLAAIRSTSGRQAFLFQLLREAFVREDMIGNGAIFASVSKDDLLRLEVLVPPEHVEADLDKQLTPYFEAIGVLSRENALLREGRDGLLPRLLREEA